VSASGFVSATRTLTVAQGTNPDLTVSLAPINSSGGVTLVLTWGAQPRDLDSHLSGPDRSGGRFHVFFGSRQQPQPSPYAVLDLDDTSSFGPETTTISRDPTTGQFVPGTYRYWVHNFSGEAPFSASQAHVTVSAGGAQIGDFDVSGASGNPAQSIWRVADLTIDAAGNVSITPVQSFTAGGSSTIFSTESNPFGLPPDSPAAPTEK
jgi:hypothetical protein